MRSRERLEKKPTNPPNTDPADEPKKKKEHHLFKNVHPKERFTVGNQIQCPLQQHYISCPYVDPSYKTLSGLGRVCTGPLKLKKSRFTTFMAETQRHAKNLRKVTAARGKMKKRLEAVYVKLVPRNESRLRGKERLSKDVGPG
jgi:hypothetical protein